MSGPMRINVYIPSALAEEYMLIKDQLNLSALVQELIRKEVDARKRVKTMSSSRQDAEDIIITWLDETVGLPVSEHVDRSVVTVLLDRLGWPTATPEAAADELTALGREMGLQ